VHAAVNLAPQQRSCPPRGQVPQRFRKRGFISSMRPVRWHGELAQTAEGLRVSISADGDVQLAGPPHQCQKHLDAGPAACHIFFCSSWPFAPPVLPVGCTGRGHRANCQSVSFAGNRQLSSHLCTQPRPTLSVGLQIGHQCRRGLRLDRDW